MMIFVASLPTFQRLFPNFQTQCQTLYTLLLPIATVLIIAGLIAAVKHCQTPRSMVRPIITSMMIVMAIALWGNWTDTAKDALSMDRKPPVHGRPPELHSLARKDRRELRARVR